MAKSSDGYLRPRQTGPLRPERDRLIAEVCPGLGVVQTVAMGRAELLWGPIVSAGIGAATNAALRHRAASGGALSAVLDHLIQSGQVDRILQTTASADHPLENITVASRDFNGILHAAGSRYAPSAPLFDLVKELEAPGTFALVGKPCDIAAVRALARSDQRINEKIPVMISFFCAGIPSSEGPRMILTKLGVDESDVAHFRYRGEGWPGRTTAVLKDGSERSLSYAESWGGVLSKHLQFRCKLCADGTGGSADAVFADAWHSDEKGYPLFEEQEGRSLILARTVVGEQLISAAVSSGFLAVAPLATSEIEHMQPSQANRKRVVLARLAALFVLGRPYPRYRNLGLLRLAFSAGIFAIARNFLGTMLRAIIRGF
jgi:coenzyme F420 hydrogenase subunit beta